MNFLNVTVSQPSYYSYLWGWSKPVPRALFENAYTTDDQVKEEVFKLLCTGGRTEVWVGRHFVKPSPTKLVDTVDHAKIWVISSDPVQHAKPGLQNIWNDLKRHRIPDTYGGDKNCAKYFTVGAGTLENGAFVGGVNFFDDVNEDLLGAVRVKYEDDPEGLKQKIDIANEVMNGNFEKTSLTCDTSFPRDFNIWALDWNKFNSNGYVSGLLKLPFFNSGAQPAGATLPGYARKSIPKAFFNVSYTTDEQVKQVIFSENPPTGLGK